MLTELERYGEQDETELRYGWIWGTTIKDHKGIIVKRVAWKDGDLTLTFWKKKKQSLTHNYTHIDTINFANSSDYFAWLPTLENWNGVE